ncbi:hypothetical protein M5E88_04415 [Akkermansia muciniphila]|nr:hypothetical protein M5E88_04415 [Akkermansia muciniphila]
MGYQICNHINSKDTHVVSNNPTLLTRLEGIPNLSFYCTGGHFDREALVYVGQDAAKAAGSLSIDMVVLTPDCYSPSMAPDTRTCCNPNSSRASSPRMPR